MVNIVGNTGTIEITNNPNIPLLWILIYFSPTLKICLFGVKLLVFITKQESLSVYQIYLRFQIFYILVVTYYTFTSEVQVLFKPKPIVL